MISPGVLSSFPSQNGQKRPYAAAAWSRSRGAAWPRLLATITQRPTIGSFRKSGIVNPFIDGVKSQSKPTVLRLLVRAGSTSTHPHDCRLPPADSFYTCHMINS